VNLTVKFNLVLIVVLVVGLVGIGYVSRTILQENARREIRDQAAVMMEAALAMRSYTVSEIKPLLTLQIKRQFLPQTVPAYAATQTFEKLREKHPEYSYKEATLNPTNPRDRAVEWEADIIEVFRNSDSVNEIFGERDTPTGRSLYFARPIQITNPACLTCHSTVDAAPDSMVERYGPANGFGWNQDEVVGAQIVVVPMSVPIEHADEALIQFMTALGGVFVAIIVILNIMLRAIIIRPIKRMAVIADDVSKGNMDAAEFTESGGDEISVLGTSFNRMRRSLDKAMKMLEE
jgi:HAMP domain-containing protein